MTTAQVRTHTRVRNGKPETVSAHSRTGPSAQPGKHRSLKGRAQLVGAGGLAFIGAVQMLTAVMNVVTAVLTVTASSLVAWGGYKGAKRRKRRRTGGGKKKPITRRFGTVTLTNEKDIEAFVKLRQQRWQRRDEVWGRRKTAAVSGVKAAGAAVVSGARSVRAKVKTP